MEFLKVDSIDEARQKLLDICPIPQVETIDISNSLGRILGTDIISNENVPYFRRSTVDGYAVVSKDTAAASESIPAFLKNIGYINIGMLTNETIKSGICIEVPTGGMLPNGADAVVMLEYTQVMGNDIAIMSSVAPGDNMVNIGDDIKIGDIVLSKGKKIMPQDIGAIAALGITKVSVYKPMAITLISTGDEIVHPTEKAENGKIRDINTYAIEAFAIQNGYSVIDTCVIPDDVVAIEEKIKTSLTTSQIVLLSGGSSQGAKDASREIINRVAAPGIFTHGLAIKPGKPTILGYDKNTNTIVGGLPGQPISAIVVFHLLFGWLNQQIMNVDEQPKIYASLTTNVQAPQGKLTFYSVKLHKTDRGYEAEPIFSKSGLITAMTQAVGYFTVEQGVEGLQKGDLVEITLF